MFHHPLSSPSSAPRIVIGVTENCIVTQLLGAQFKAFDDFGKKWIFNIGNNDSQSAVTVARSQVTRMRIGNIAQALHGGDHQAVSFAADFPGFI